jgi:hypothetical protein
VSITWEAINPALLDLFTVLARPTLGDDTGVDAEHANRPRKLIKPQVGYGLTMSVATVVGLDASTVHDFDANAGALTETISAHRRVTYRLRVESVKNDDISWAFAPMERIRTRLRMTRSREALLELNASLLTCQPTVLADFPKDGKVYSAAVMDVVLLVRVNESDTEPLDWIQSVTISSDKIKDADGTDLPAALQMTNVVVDGAGDPP